MLADFSPLAPQYERGRRGVPEPIMQLLGERICRGGPVLDLGMGTGIGTEQMRKAGYEMIGCDLSFDMIRHAPPRRKLSGRAVAGDARALPIASASLRAVTCFSAFHWFSSPDAVREILRVLMPRGTLAIVNKIYVDRIRAQIAEVFTRYTGAVCAREAYDPARTLERHGFVEVEDAVWPDEERYTVEQQLGYYQSVSNWKLVPEHKRKSVLREFREILECSVDDCRVTREVHVLVVTGHKPK